MNTTTVPDDGLHLPPISRHSLQKHEHIRRCAEVFAKVTRSRWHERVYIDLFAGAGHAKVKDTGEIVKTSAFLSMDVQPAFDRHILCDASPECIHALQVRVAARASSPTGRVHIIHGDANDTAAILRSMPQPSKGHTVLSFCVIDPFRLRDLDFGTIRALASRYVDFLVLLPDSMELNRFPEQYLSNTNDAVERFTGCRDWRDKWRLWSGQRPKGSMALFFDELFATQMSILGYKDTAPHEMTQVNVDGMGVKLYKLALFSRHDLGKKVAEVVRKYSSPQQEFSW
jgi:three-Cys-motif partner protein